MTSTTHTDITLFQSYPPLRENERCILPFYKGGTRDLSSLGSMYSSGYVRLSASVVPSWSAMNAPGERHMLHECVAF